MIINDIFMAGSVCELLEIDRSYRTKTIYLPRDKWKPGEQIWVAASALNELGYLPPRILLDMSLTIRHFIIRRARWGTNIEQGNLHGRLAGEVWLAECAQIQMCLIEPTSLAYLEHTLAYLKALEGVPPVELDQDGAHPAGYTGDEPQIGGGKSEVDSNA